MTRSSSFTLFKPDHRQFRPSSRLQQLANFGPFSHDFHHHTRATAWQKERGEILTLNRAPLCLVQQVITLSQCSRASERKELSVGRVYHNVWSAEFFSFHHQLLSLQLSDVWADCVPNVRLLVQTLCARPPFWNTGCVAVTQRCSLYEARGVGGQTRWFFKLKVHRGALKECRRRGSSRWRVIRTPRKAEVYGEEQGGDKRMSLGWSHYVLLGERAHALPGPKGNSEVYYYHQLSWVGVSLFPHWREFDLTSFCGFFCSPNLYFIAVLCRFLSILWWIYLLKFLESSVRVMSLNTG